MASWSPSRTRPPGARHLAFRPLSARRWHPDDGAGQHHGSPPRGRGGGPGGSPTISSRPSTRRCVASRAGSFPRRGGYGNLDTTELVHEAYLKLSHGAPWSIRDRYHFYAATARAMRQVIVDDARRRFRSKRGSGVPPRALDDVAETLPRSERPEELLALDEALTRLETADPELARIVEWRFFNGLSVEDIAQDSRSLRANGQAPLEDRPGVSLPAALRLRRGAAGVTDPADRRMREAAPLFEELADLPADEAQAHLSDLGSQRTHRSRRSCAGFSRPSAAPAIFSKAEPSSTSHRRWYASSTGEDRAATASARRVDRSLRSGLAPGSRRHGRGLDRRAQGRRVRATGRREALDGRKGLRGGPPALSARAPGPREPGASSHRQAPRWRDSLGRPALFRDGARPRRSHHGVLPQADSSARGSTAPRRDLRRSRRGRSSTAGGSSRHQAVQRARGRAGRGQAPGFRNRQGSLGGARRFADASRGDACSRRAMPLRSRSWASRSRRRRTSTRSARFSTRF